MEAHLPSNVPVKGEVAAAMADPNVAVEITFGPSNPELVPQAPGTGLQLGRHCANQVTRFVFKKAHLSREDFRIFDANGRLVCNSHHHGKNPYASLDPLGVGYDPNAHSYLGEMESLCNVTGYQGMPSFKIRPKALSLHGRQLAVDSSGRTLFSVGKISRIKTMSLRHNLEVCIGDDDDEAYIIEADLMGRTMQFKNKQGQLVAFVAKSKKALIQTAVLGSGSELEINVAPGVDWTSVLGMLMVVQQVGAHYLKDLFENFVMEPLKEAVVDTAVEATGTEAYVNQAAHYTNSATHTAHNMQNAHAQFQHLKNHF